MLSRVSSLFLVCCCVLGLSIARVSANSLDTYVSSLSDQLLFSSSDSLSVKNIVQKYCQAVQTSPLFTGDDFVYSADQSAFVFLLCNHVGMTSSFDTRVFAQGIKDDANKKIFKVATFKGFGISSLACSSSTSMNGCDLSKALPPLFSTILNDYTNIKQSNLYGVTQTKLPKETLITLADSFARAYFTPGLVLCGEGSRYPQTCAAMKDYIQSASKSFSNSTLFYPDALVAWSSAVHDSCSLGSSNYLFIPCGLLGDSRDSLQGFTALLYNEEFYYRLFINYYMIVLSANPQIISSSPDVISRDIFEKKTRFANELLWTQKAISSTIRSLRDVYAAFPLHLGFMLYQEDLMSFGKRLATLADPLYTLSDKLKNVQKP